MHDQTDCQLLRAYAEEGSERAFAELARRHVDFVYSAALRMVCDAHLAQDVTQSVFVALARNPVELTDRPVLSGWLHRTAQNLAANVVRTEVRRRVREREALAMDEMLSHQADGAWENIAPNLDTALGELSEQDRDALLLRYFERKSAREMARALNVSEEAAQKRVNRALERLRELFSKQKVTIGVGGLVAVLSTNAVQAAPLGVTATFAASATGSGVLSTSSAAISKGTLKLFAGIHMKMATLISASLGPLASAVGSWFAIRAAIRCSESAPERKARVRFGSKLGTSTVALAVFTSVLSLIDLQSHAWWFGIGLACSVIGYVALVLFWSFSHAKELNGMRTGDHI